MWWDEGDQHEVSRDLHRGGVTKDRLDVTEMVEDRSDRDFGPVGDLEGGRPGTAGVDQIDHRLDDDQAGVIATDAPSVGWRPYRSLDIAAARTDPVLHHPSFAT
jgi:hypothetical protein